MMAQPLDHRTISPFVKDICGTVPGKHWLTRFLRRNRDRVKYCRTSALDPKRAKCFNYPTVKDHFEKLKAIIDEHDIPPENIYNMDEKGCQLGGGRKGRRKKYLFGCSSQARYRVRDANLELVTIVECVSADGQALKPYIIFKGKRLNKDWYTAKGIERAQAIGVSDNGWIDNNHCEKWLEQGFLPQVEARNISGKPILLICDGHRSHCTGTLMVLARKGNIYIFCLPPHTTHKLQPLDVGILGPLQTKFADRVDAFVLEHGHGVGKKEFIEEYLTAREEAINSALIVSAFKHCGIHPFNPDIFGEEDFAPAKAFSILAASHLPEGFPEDPALQPDAPSDNSTDSDDSNYGDSESVGGSSEKSATCSDRSSLSSDASKDKEKENGMYSSDLVLPAPASTICQPILPPSVLPTISPSSTIAELRLVIVNLIERDKVRSNENKLLRDQVLQANAHAVILGRRFTELMNKYNAKKSPGTTRGFESLARVMNTDKALAIFAKEKAEEEANTAALLLREALALQHTDRLAMYLDAAKAGVNWAKNRERSQKKAITNAARARKGEAAAVVKAAMLVKKQEEKAARDARRLVSSTS